jgi:hypothetical protein
MSYARLMFDALGEMQKGMQVGILGRSCLVFVIRICAQT